MRGVRVRGVGVRGVRVRVVTARCRRVFRVGSTATAFAREGTRTNAVSISK